MKSSVRVFSAVALTVAAAALILVQFDVVAAQSPRPDATTLTVVSPEPDAYVSGPTVIQANVAPPGAATSVAFFVDGGLACTVTRIPFECRWDAGRTVIEHQLRVVATLAAGGRIVRTVRTKAVGYVESVDVNTVQVTATVTEGHGHFVRRLPQSAFHLLEDGQPQAITYFTSENVPLELLVAIDISGSMTPSMPKLKAAVKAFLTAVPPKDQVTLLAFNDGIFSLATRATDPAERIKAVDGLLPFGSTALYDVIIEGVGRLGHEAGRKVMIVFTDGEDEGSHAPIEEVERRLQASDVTLYMIGQGRGTLLPPLKKIIQRLAAPTGGRALFTERIDELQAAFTELLDELSSQYLLSYTSANTRRDDGMRRIKVDVDGHGDVRAKQGYRPSAKP
jgi:Ca-activated chloride channel family protein